MEPAREKLQDPVNKALTENQYLVLSVSLEKILQKHPEVKSIMAAGQQFDSKALPAKIVSLECKKYDYPTGQKSDNNHPLTLQLLVIVQLRAICLRMS